MGNLAAQNVTWTARRDNWFIGPNTSAVHVTSYMHIISAFTVGGGSNKVACATESLKDELYPMTSNSQLRLGTEVMAGGRVGSHQFSCLRPRCCTLMGNRAYLAMMQRQRSLREDSIMLFFTDLVAIGGIG